MSIFSFHKSKSKIDRFLSRNFGLGPVVGPLLDVLGGEYGRMGMTRTQYIKEGLKCSAALLGSVTFCAALMLIFSDGPKENSPVVKKAKPHTTQSVSQTKIPGSPGMNR